MWSFPSPVVEACLIYRRWCVGKRASGMAWRVLRGLALTTAIGLAPTLAFATPSTTYWAPTVATCQGYGVPHVTYDTYYGKGTPSPGAPGAAAYPIDTGLTMGLIPGNKIQAEFGYDLLLPSTDPVGFFLNGKVCTPEGSMFKGSPGIGLGIYNIGFHGVNSTVAPTNFNTLYLVGQKSLPVGGYFSIGFYHGLGPDILYTNSEGK